MDKYRLDQAEGLRRMLAGSRPRVFTFLSSASSEEKSAMLVNLAASLAESGKDVLMVDARLGLRGIASWLEVSQAVTLLNVARREYDLEDAIHTTQEGFGIATLTRGAMGAVVRNRTHFSRLAASFDALASHYDVMMVDAELDGYGSLPLAAMADGEVVVQVSDNPASITAAYSIIKNASAQQGVRAFSVLVTGTSEARAQVVYANMARAARRYLAVPLNSIGFVPADDFVRSTTHRGGGVSDACRMAGASVAFRRLAGYFSCSAVPVA